MKAIKWDSVTMKTVMIVLALAMVLITACSSNNTASNSPSQPAAVDNASTPAAESSPGASDEELPHVELIWYYGTGATQPDQQKVEDAANDYLAKNTNLNVTLRLKPLNYGGEYNDKMNPIIASREKFDIMWTTAAWVNLYQPLIDKGALVPLDDLLEKYAPKTRHDIMPESYWDSIRSPGDNKIYAIFSLQIAASPKGFAFQKRFVDKYNFDLSTVKTTKDIEPFLKTIKENEKDIIPLAFPNIGGNGPFYPDNIGATGSIHYYKNDPYTAINRENTPEYKEYLNLIHDWYEKGYVYQDLATVQDFSQLQAKGNIAVTAEQGIFPGSDATIAARSNNEPMYTVAITPPLFSGANGTMNGISTTSENPERAMMLLELVNTDKDFYRILCYGIEGTHYTLDNGIYKPIPDGGYAPNIDWVFGNTFNGYIKEGQPLDLIEQTKKMNAEAEVPPALGFNFDTSAYQTEIAATRSVWDEFVPGLETGTYDPAVYYPKFIDARNKAGQQKLDDALKEQLADWVAKNVKQ